MINSIIQLLEQRKATRSISQEPLPDNIIEELIEAARLTPSCYNNQPWRFLFLETSEALTKGRDALSSGNRAWAERAPLLAVGYSRREDDCVLKDGRAYHEFDLGMSVMNLMLAATSCELVARPMAGFNPEKIKQAFQLDGDAQPLVMLAIGKESDDESHLPDNYKGVSKKPRERRKASEIVQRF